MILLIVLFLIYSNHLYIKLNTYALEWFEYDAVGS